MADDQEQPESTELQVIERDEQEQEQGKPPDHDQDAGAGADGSSTARKAWRVVYDQITEGFRVAIFTSPSGEAWAWLPQSCGRETVRLESAKMQTFVDRVSIATLDDALSDADLKKLWRFAKAQAQRVESEPSVRVFDDRKGRRWLDLGPGRAVRITAEGWTIEDEAPAPFLRPDGFAELPTPQRGGDLDQLWKVLPIPVDSRPLVVAWLVQALIPGGAVAILALHGAAGSGKSLSTSMLKSLVDPDAVGLTAPPDDQRSLMLAAQMGHILVIDNLSTLSGSMSDALCRLATGAATRERRLYTNGDVVTIKALRPVLANGIPSMGEGRGDLAERSVIVRLQAMAPEQRRSPDVVRRELDEMRPLILGRLLDAAVVALRDGAVILQELRPTRMIDFDVVGVACERTFGWEPGSFLRAREHGVAAVMIERLDDPVVDTLVSLLVERGTWRGKPADLLATLTDLQPRPKPRFWPDSARVLGEFLTRAEGDLHHAGITFTKLAVKGRTVYVLELADHAERKSKVI